MKMPLARIAGVTDKTFNAWLENREIAKRKGFYVYESTEAPHHKKGRYQS
jgi:hypothetical protein